MDVDFPPLRSLGHEHQPPRTRAHRCSAATATSQRWWTLADPDARLVTLTGPGGTGKTRLAVARRVRGRGELPGRRLLRAARRVHHVDEAMWSTIADRLRLAEDRSAERVLDEVAHRRLLLVLDNLEQIPEADARRRRPPRCRRPA